jgi:hypothetical protein
MELRDLDQISEQYRAEGYNVVVHPQDADLPEFLRRHSIDLLARKANESVVVAVSTRKDLRANQDLTDLAGEVNSRPGWRFDLIVANGGPWPDAVADDSRELGESQVRELSETAERLLDQEELTAACLLAGSGVEASLRALARRAGIALEKYDPQYILNALATEGVIDRCDFQLLHSALRVRNAVAHGLHTPALDASLVRQLIDAPGQLLVWEPAIATN